MLLSKLRVSSYCVKGECQTTWTPSVATWNILSIHDPAKDELQPSFTAYTRSFHRSVIAQFTMSLIIEFLSSIHGFVLAQNGEELKNWLLVENDVPEIYFQLGRELQSSFPDNGSDALEKLVDKCLPIEDHVDGKGSPWPGFNSMIKAYLEYWRDVDFDNLVRLHASLSDLLMCVSSVLSRFPLTCTARARMLSPIPHMESCYSKLPCPSPSRYQSWLWG